MGINTEGVLTLTPPSYPGGIIRGDESDPLQRWYELSATQNYEPGTLLVYGDGRKFRYALDSGSGTSKGLMTQGSAQVSNLITETQSTSGTSVEIGDQQITVDITTGSALADDDLQQGQLVVQTGTAAGDRHKILGSKIQSTDTLLDILLEDTIRTAWDATTVIDLTRNPWYKTSTFPTSSYANRATGVPQVAVTASYWYWAQTGGAATVITDAGDTIIVGRPCGLPGTHGTAGGIGVVGDDGTDPVWGVVMVAPGGGKYATVWLTLD